MLPKAQEIKQKLSGLLPKSFLWILSSQLVPTFCNSMVSLAHQAPTLSSALQSLLTHVHEIGDVLTSIVCYPLLLSSHYLSLSFFALLSLTISDSSYKSYVCLLCLAYFANCLRFTDWSILLQMMGLPYFLKVEQYFTVVILL